MNRRRVLTSLLSGASGLVIPRGASASEPTAPSVAPRPSFIQARDGTRLYFEDWGAGPPIVFLAPWSLDSRWWEYQVAGLAARGVRCITVDRRGHGRSDRPAAGYDFDALAQDVAEVISQLRLRDVTLVGHSMGCAEVVRYVTRHRAGGLARLVLVSTITPFLLKTGDNPGGIDAAVFARGRADLALDRPHQIARAADAFFGAPANPVSVAVKEWWTRMMVDHCSLLTMLELHRVFTTTDFRPELRRIALRTLIIHGDRDASALLDMTGRPTAGLIPDAELRLYEGAAHGLPVTHAERLNDDLLSFATS